jgi:GNAT superfamily N-acetyltransferase
MPPAPRLVFHPVTSERLPDLQRFLEAHGRFGHCACMRWRMRSAVFSRSTRDGRNRALTDTVRGGLPVGVLAYLDEEPVGWCSVAPRQCYAALERYRALPRLDEQPVWSVVCFFVASRIRRTGATRGLLEAAVDYAGRQGAKIVEGYPVEPGARLYTYMGSPATFRAVGFVDVTPPGQQRKVMRYMVKPHRARRGGRRTRLAKTATAH